MTCFLVKMMIFNKVSSYFTLLAAWILINSVALAQTADFQSANRLMQQQNFQEALPILEQLYEQNPGSLLFFDQYTSCLINLTRYEDAEKVAREQIQMNRFRPQAVVKLAEILHIKGDREQALEIWKREAQEYRNNIQYYYSIGSSMSNRQEFDAAIELYQKGREVFNNRNLFINELADTYMQAGRFEQSVNEFYRLVLDSPDQMSLVQQRFFNMRDHSLYEIAAFELEDLLLELHYTDAAYSSLYQLLTWLLMETKEYRRAFLFARQYESQTPFTIYSLFSLGSQFLSAREFELAVEAFEYYLQDSIGSMRYRAKEELANSYIRWAQYLQQNNLDRNFKVRDLNQKAYELNSTIILEDENYSRADRVLAALVDLSVDFFRDLEKAEQWLHMMENQAERERIDPSFFNYAKGRVALFKSEFSLARQFLTRADRTSDSSNLSEKARFYLGLSDFFAGDYEFAEIQLRSLERRNTSFYANDAIKLNMWIQNGIRADTTMSMLNSISEGIYHLHTGFFNGALDIFEPILANSRNPFAADITVELVSVLPAEYNLLLILLTERVLQAQPYSSQKERLMWDRARLVEISMSQGLSMNLPYSYQFLENSVQISYSERDLIEMLEDIILEFPNGFYAPAVRNKLQSLEYLPPGS